MQDKALKMEDSPAKSRTVGKQLCFVDLDDDVLRCLEKECIGQMTIFGSNTDFYLPIKAVNQASHKIIIITHRERV